MRAKFSHDGETVTLSREEYLMLQHLHTHAESYAYYAIVRKDSHKHIESYLRAMLAECERLNEYLERPSMREFEGDMPFGPPLR